jgi:hypothetical protein
VRARRSASMRAALLACLLSSSAFAHTAAPTRSLRLQLEEGSIAGLLIYRLPPGPRAQVLLAVPSALTARGGNAGEALGLRLAPEALRGLRFWLGRVPLAPAPAADAPLAAAAPATAPAAASATAPVLLEARARKDSSGALEAALLIRAARAPEPGETLRVEADAGALPLPVTLIAPSGWLLELTSGAGQTTPGGLLLHPAPGKPCAVRLSIAAPLH